MKKLIFTAMVFTFTAFATVNANVINETIAVVAQGEETAVNPEELPEAVRTTLTSEEYEGWTVSSATLVKGEKEYYKIELTNGEETQVVNIDAEGNIVE